MKTIILLTAILLSLMVGCDLDDGGSGGGGTIPDPGSSFDNSSGAYDGAWRLVTYNEEGIEKIIFDQYPEHSSIDSSEDMNTLIDTTEIIVLKGDSAAIYEYNSDDGDTFTIDYFLLSSLDEEYDTTGIYKEMTDELLELNEEGAPFEFIVNANELYNGITLAGDTLRVELGLNYDISFSTDITNEEIADYFEIELGTVTGQYQVYEYILYEMVRYTGLIPPESWPDNFVIDTSDSENNIAEELLGSWQMEYADAEMKILYLLVVNSDQVMLNEIITEIYVGGETLTGEAMAAFLSKEGIENPNYEIGTWELNDETISILWEGDSTSEEMGFSLYGETLTLYTSEGTMIFMKKG